ncbi:hypothetical protein QTP88_014941 [Uroleucon formosanum]
MSTFLETPYYLIFIQIIIIVIFPNVFGLRPSEYLILIRFGLSLLPIGWYLLIEFVSNKTYLLHDLSCG